MNTKDYVTINTAKLLKEAGFPQEYKLSLGGALIAQEDGAFCRPSLWDAMQWLRDKMMIILNIGFYIDRNDNGERIRGRWLIDFRRDLDAEILRDIQGIFLDIIGKWPQTYEQIADAGVAAACKWITSKNE